MNCVYRCCLTGSFAVGNERAYCACARVVAQQPERIIAGCGINDYDALCRGCGVVPHVAHLVAGCGTRETLHSGIAYDSHVWRRAVASGWARAGRIRSLWAVGSRRARCHGGRGAAVAACWTGCGLRCARQAVLARSACGDCCRGAAAVAANRTHGLGGGSCRACVSRLAWARRGGSRQRAYEPCRADRWGA